LTYFSLLKNLLDKRSDLREIQSYIFRQRYQNGKISLSINKNWKTAQVISTHLSPEIEEKQMKC